MSPEVRLGVVGAGVRAYTLVSALYDIRDQDYFHYPRSNAYTQYSHTPPSWVENLTELKPTISAIFDPDESAINRMVNLCAEHGDTPEIYSTSGEFLQQSEVDAVLNASPNNKHAETSIPLINHGFPVFCEKPIATTLRDYDRLADEIAESDVSFYVGFNMRSNPVYRLVKQHLDQNKIGDLGMIMGHTTRNPLPPGFRYTEDGSGGALLEKNCHDFDLFNWFARGDPVRVASMGGKHVLTDAEINDHATVIVEYDNGIKGTLELCLYSPFNDRAHRYYNLRGTDGMIEQREKDSIHIQTPTTDERIKARQSMGVHGGADVREMMGFLRYLMGEEEPPATLEDAKKSAAIAIGAEASIARNEIVEITPEYNLRTSAGESL